MRTPNTDQARAVNSGLVAVGAVGALGAFRLDPSYGAPYIMRKANEPHPR
jgi:hypothetical protein